MILTVRADRLEMGDQIVREVTPPLHMRHNLGPRVSYPIVRIELPMVWTSEGQGWLIECDAVKVWRRR